MYISVIGLGSVGKAVLHGLGYYHDVVGFDIDGRGSFGDVLKTEACMVCVSTDEDDSNRLDMSNVESVLNKLDNSGYEGLVVVKSTVGVGFFDRIRSNYSLRLAYAPEFLREATPFQFFVYLDRLVFSAQSRVDYEVLDKIFYWARCSVWRLSFIETEIMKLAHNAKIAADVSFANEVKHMAEQFNANPKAIMDAIVADRRRTLHWLDPTKGPYQGKCVPKDTRDLMNATNSVLLKAVEEVNEREIRKYESRDSS